MNAVIQILPEKVQKHSFIMPLSKLEEVELVPLVLLLG